MSLDKNELCPCGSGKKYKICCFKKQQISSFPADKENDSTQEALSEQILSLEEMQEFAESFIENHNLASVESFDGLSPEQMHRFLYFPFDTPEWVTFSQLDGIAIDSPIIFLFSLLFEAIGDNGLKTTAKGNLPRNFCRQSAEVYFQTKENEYPFSAEKIRNEQEFADMHYVRIVSEMTGLVRKYKGKFVSTKKCRSIMSKHGIPGIYRELFFTYCNKFNWGYCDAYPEVPIFQQSFLYTLLLLSKYGESPQSQQFYVGKFMLAYPFVQEELPELSYISKENQIRNCYMYRVFNNFAHFFGLIELTATGTEEFIKIYSVRKRPLLDQFISFHC